MAAVPPKSYGIRDFKSRVLNIAQTSLYQLTIVPPQGLSFSPNMEDISLLCSEANLPGSSLAAHDVTNDFHGVSEKMAYRRMYDQEISLTFYVDRNYNVINFFEQWIEFIVGDSTTDYLRENAFHRVNYPNMYRSTMHIVKFEKDHHSVGKAPLPSKLSAKQTIDYTFVGAFPLSVTSMPISYNQSDLLKCTVSFSFIRYVINGRSTTSKSAILPRSPQTLESEGAAAKYQGSSIENNVAPAQDNVSPGTVTDGPDIIGDDFDTPITQAERNAVKRGEIIDEGGNTIGRITSYGSS